MRASARAVILKDTSILLIHRYKDGKEYYVVPGGGIEEGETPEQTVIREVKEELSLTITIEKRIGEYMNGEDPMTFFLIRSFTGDVAISGPEKEIMRADSSNTYIPVWIEISKIDEINLVPVFIKDIIKSL